MRRWSYFLGGLIVWAAHFSSLYAIASLDAQTAAADGPRWRLAATLVSGLCVLVCSALGAVALRRLRSPNDAGARLVDQVALLGVATALVAIIWQTLPILIG